MGVNAAGVRTPPMFDPQGSINALDPSISVGFFQNFKSVLQSVKQHKTSMLYFYLKIHQNAFSGRDYTFVHYVWQQMLDIIKKTLIT